MIHTALLARMTDWVEQGHGLGFVEYISTERKHRFEVEHIWANHPDRHTAEVPDPRDFANQRNKFGDLVLLPKDFNASYGVGITQQKGWLGHTGTLPWYNTDAVYDPNTDTTIVVLANSDISEKPRRGPANTTTDKIIEVLQSAQTG